MCRLIVLPTQIWRNTDCHTYQSGMNISHHDITSLEDNKHPDIDINNMAYKFVNVRSCFLSFK